MKRAGAAGSGRKRERELRVNKISNTVANGSEAVTPESAEHHVLAPTRGYIIHMYR